MSASHRHRMFDGLLSVRADAQSLLTRLDAIDKAGALVDASVRDAQILVTVREGLALFGRRKLVEHWRKIETAREEDPSLGAEWGDALEIILNAIEDLQDAWPRSPDPAQALAETTRARALLVEIFTEAAKLTIPGRLKEHLSQRSTGRALDFNATFEDELPDPEVRKAFMKELQEYEGRSFNGVIDVERGMVYVTSPVRWKRALSCLAPLITAVMLGGVLYGVSALDIDWPLASSEPLLEGYVLVLLGMVVHLLVENVKQFEMGTRIVVVGDKLTWMHLRWVALCWSIVPAAVTAVGLRFGGVPGADDWETYLFAGYAADSIAGLFLTRYADSAKKTADAIQAVLKKGSQPTIEVGSS